jgi:hypothetical protein
VGDNYITNPGAGGITFAGDEDGAFVQWPLIKLAWGPLDTFNILADAPTKRLPINLAECGITLNVAAAALPLPAGAATSAKQPALGTAGAAAADVITVQGIAAMTALKVDGSAVTQPISGTTTANQGTANTVANAWPVKNTDGTNVAAVKAASTAPLATDPALVVTISPNSPSAGNPAAGATGAAVPASADYTGYNSGGNLVGVSTANPLPVAQQGTVTVSGTVTTTPPANASTNVAQFGGTNVVTGTGVGGAGIPRVTVSSDSVVGISGTVTVAGTVTADTELPAAAALTDTNANPTTPMIGSATLAWDATNSVWRRVQVTAATGKLLVDGSTVTQPVSGTVTANQGGAPWSQNLTQVAGAAVSLGAKTSANSIPVVLASDEATLPVSIAGTVTVTGGLTDTQLRASPVPVTGSLSIAASTSPSKIENNLDQYNDNQSLYVALDPESDPPTGSQQEQQRSLLASIAASNPPPAVVPPIIGQITGTTAAQVVGPITLNGASRALVVFQGTYGVCTAVLEVSADGAVWFGARAIRPPVSFVEGVANGAIALSANSSQADVADVAGWPLMRVRASAFTTGVLQVTVVLSQGAPAVVAAVATGQNGDGVAPTGFPVRIGGTGTDALVHSLSVDATGQLFVNQGAAGAASWPVSVPAGITVTSSALPTGAPTETAGVLQRIEELLEQLVIEARVHNIVLASLNGRPEDPDSVRRDISLTTIN